MSHIHIKDLHKSFANNPILRGINLDIPIGQLVCLIGRSGCGKSTLLRCINGLEILDSGSIEVGSHSLESMGYKKFQKKAGQLRRIVGFVFQQFQLFPHLTLLENVVMAPIVVQKVSVSDATARAKRLLERVGLSNFGDRYPAQLSGGQQQRGAIARALALQPQVMLYDEPTSALDPELVDEVLQVMKALDRDENITQVIVTHEMRFARDAADTVVFIDEGKVVEQGPPDVVFTAPKDERTRLFLKKILT